MEKYQIERIVGRGAYGTVYLCKDQASSLPVIIKQIPMEQMSSSDRQATMNEVRVLSMLAHPNIIKYHESFLHDRAMMIVMEFAAGGSLHDLIEARAREGLYLEEEEEIAFLFAQIIIPMHYIHSKNILHRDLKAQNIFLTGSPRIVKIGDFGISKILTSKSKASTVVGTPSYISPELCEGRPYNQKSDVWSLGCILYELSSLKRAFQAPTLPALVLKIMKGHFQPLPPHYSASLKSLISWMLELDPRKRPTLAHVMAHPWMATHLYRLRITLGALPCTSKERPPSSMLLRPGTPSSHFHQAKRFGCDASSLVSLLLVKVECQQDQSHSPLILHETREKVSQIAAVGSDEALCLTADGKVLMVGSSGGGQEKANCRVFDSFVGIVIKYVATAPNVHLICMITNRGILITKGKGGDGCLGHGDFEQGKKPRIVEALLGEEVTDVACSDKHVLAVTDRSLVFAWGINEDGCLGLSDKGSKEKMFCSPQRVPLEASAFDRLRNNDIKKVRVGPKCSAIILSNGDLFVCGRNRGNRLFLGEEKACLTFKQIIKFSVADVQFGPCHSVTLRKDERRILNIGVGIIRKELDMSETVTTIDTTCNREKANFALALTKSGKLYHWKIDDNCDLEKPLEDVVDNVAVYKSHFILTKKNASS